MVLIPKWIARRNCWASCNQKRLSLLKEAGILRIRNKSGHHNQFSHFKYYYDVASEGFILVGVELCRAMAERKYSRAAARAARGWTAWKEKY